MELFFDPKFSLLIVNCDVGGTFLRLPKAEVVRYMKFCFLRLYQQNVLDLSRTMIMSVFQNS